MVSGKSIASYSIYMLPQQTVNGRPADQRLHFTPFGVPTTWNLFSADDVLLRDQQNYATGRAESNSFANLVGCKTDSPAQSLSKL